MVLRKKKKVNVKKVEPVEDEFDEEEDMEEEEEEEEEEQRYPSDPKQIAQEVVKELPPTPIPTTKTIKKPDRAEIEDMIEGHLVRATQLLGLLRSTP